MEGRLTRRRRPVYYVKKEEEEEEKCEEEAPASAMSGMPKRNVLFSVGRSGRECTVQGHISSGAITFSSYGIFSRKGESWGGGGKSVAFLVAIRVPGGGHTGHWPERRMPPLAPPIKAIAIYSIFEGRREK